MSFSYSTTMFNSLLSFFNKKSLDVRNIVTHNHVYRDELSEEPFSCYKNNGSYFEISEPLIKSTPAEKEDGRGVVVRVKVKMTKQEAARMLSKCKNGGVLQFKDVANELTRIPTDRVTVDQPLACTSSGAGPLLKCIC